MIQYKEGDDFFANLMTKILNLREMKKPQNISKYELWSVSSVNGSVVS